MEAVNLGPSPREREEERESARLWELREESGELRGIKATEEEEEEGEE